MGLYAHWVWPIGLFGHVGWHAAVACVMYLIRQVALTAGLKIVPRIAMLQWAQRWSWAGPSTPYNGGRIMRPI